MPQRFDNDPKPWTTLSSQYLSRKPWLTLRQDRAQLPSGAIAEEYFVLEYPDWINVIAVTTDRRLVMVRQYRYGIGQVHFELPAGVCDKEDADAKASARRELLEETGYGGGEWEHFMTLSANPGTQTNRTHTFLAKNVERIQRQELEPTEDVVVHLISLEEAREIVTGDDMIQALHAAPLLKFLLLESETKP